MATLIAVYRGNVCVGRCDEKCYNAIHPHCDCICGGKNHGAGIQQARDNTREMVGVWVKEYKDRKGLDESYYHKTEETINQISLF